MNRLSEIKQGFHRGLDEWTPEMKPVVKSVHQLIDLIDRENDLLLKGELPDFADITARKSRYLFELNRVVGNIDLDIVSQSRLTPLLVELKAKLQKNRDILQLNIETVSELADVVHDVLQQNDADGTYTQITPYENCE